MAPPEGKGEARPAPGQMGRTQLGMQAVDELARPAKSAEKPAETSAAAGRKEPAQEQSSTGGPERNKALGKTMLGVAPVVGPKDAAAPKPAQPQFKHTLLGAAAPSRPTAGEETSADRTSGDPLARTAQGVAPDANAAGNSRKRAEGTAASTQPSTTQPSTTQPGTTQPGMQQGGAADRNGAPAAARARTMLGMPQVAPPQPGAPKPPPSASTESREEAKEPGGGELSHTLLDAPSASRSSSPPPVGGRTMLGVGLQHAMPRPPAAREPSEPPYRVSDSEPVAGAGVGSRSGVWLMAGAVLLLAALAAAYLVMTRDSSAGVRASVTRTDEGEVMMFEVPGAPAGSKLRFGGQEQRLEAGRASFPLSADSLRVGSNAVLVEVVSPGGEIDSARILLEVDYRVTVDSAPLRSGEPAVDVVVSARPGSTVLLDGKPIALDAKGNAVRRDTIDLSQQAASGVIEHTVSYRVEPPEGEASVGELTTRVPVTLMQIDKPGLSLVTDQSEVDIAGAVAQGASVTIDGKPIDVKAGRFLHKYALPAPGQYQPKVVASVEGKAPNVAVIDLRRVEDLAKAAQGFEADASLTYAKIAQNPAIYRGQKVAFDARIYNIKVQHGQTVLQALVRNCPSGQACSLWVTYPAATELTKQSWVKVLGTVAGEQQFRSEQDKVQTVPKVEAAFLLPTKL